MIVYDAKDLVPVVEARAQPTVLEARESSTLIEGRAAAVDQFNQTLKLKAELLKLILQTARETVFVEHNSINWLNLSSNRTHIQLKLKFKSVGSFDLISL